MITEGIIAAIAAGAGALVTAVGTLIVGVIKAKKEKTGDKELEYGHTETLVKLVSGQTQELLEVKNILSNMCEELSEKIEAVDEKLDDFIEEQKEFNLTMLRHDITSTYYEYKDKDEIPEPVYMSTLDLYDKYTKLGGNSWVSNLVEDFKWRKTKE